MQGLAVWEKEDLEDIGREAKTIKLNDAEKERVRKQLDQFRRDRLPLTMAKQYLRLFRDYYRYNKQPPQKFSDASEVTKTHDQQVADRFKVYDGMDFSEYKPGVIDEALEKAKSFAEFPDFIANGVGLMLLGSPGLGKTALTKSICRHINDHAFISAPQLTRIIRGQSSEKNIIIQRLISATLLVIDDLGQEYGSDFSDSEFDYIVSERERNNLSMIITSNLFLSDLEGAEGYTERITDRLKARCFVVEMKGESYRKLKGVANNG